MSDYYDKQLFDAIDNHDIARMEEAFRCGADIEAADEYNRSPLYRACALDELNVEVVRCLLKHGASVKSQPKELTPLHVISLSNTLEGTKIASLLLEAGAEVEADDGVGFTPLHKASHSGSTGTAKLLLKWGASANKMADNGRTPLDLAKFFGRNETARVLSEHAANQVNNISPAGLKCGFEYNASTQQASSNSSYSSAKRYVKS